MERLDGHHHNMPPLSEIDAPKWASRRSLPEPPEFTAADSEELRFTLREMFLATTLAAIMLALFRTLGIYGAVFSFLSAVIATLLLIPHLFPKDRPRQRMYFDFVWGVVMPVVCLVFDPFVFKHGDFEDDVLLFPKQQPFSAGGVTQIVINPVAYYAWPLLAGQIATLGVVMAWGKSLRPIAPILAGILATGFVISLCLSVFLALPAALGALFFGIGLLGFTPIFTCRTYFRRMRLMWFVARGERSHEWQLALAALGVILCLGLTLAIGVMALYAAPPKATINS